MPADGIAEQQRKRNIDIADLGMSILLPVVQVATAGISNLIIGNDPDLIFKYMSINGLAIILEASAALGYNPIMKRLGLKQKNNRDKYEKIKSGLVFTVGFCGAFLATVFLRGRNNLEYPKKAIYAALIYTGIASTEFLMATEPSQHYTYAEPEEWNEPERKQISPEERARIAKEKAKREKERKKREREAKERERQERKKKECEQRRERKARMKREYMDLFAVRLSDTELAEPERTYTDMRSELESEAFLEQTESSRAEYSQQPETINFEFLMSEASQMSHASKKRNGRMSKTESVASFFDAGEISSTSMISLAGK